MVYREHPSAISGAVLWHQSASADVGPRRILPDGCMDLIWDGQRLLVAGPDTAARWHQSAPGTKYVGLRFSGGVGPALLGVPAHEIVDQYPDLDQLWCSGPARALADRVANDPEAEMERWAVAAVRRNPPDPLGDRVQQMAAKGLSVAAMADRTGYSTRQLHRRCLPLFGYGPQHLVRILRLGRALDEARTGRPLADVAADCGYADQAHLTREARSLTETTPTALLLG